jgi:hypothetical protein
MITLAGDLLSIYSKKRIRVQLFLLIPLPGMHDGFDGGKLV